MTAIGTFTIPEENWGRFRERLAQIVRRAEKLGMPPPTMTEPQPRNMPAPRAPGTAAGRFVRAFEVEVEGVQPAIAGWTFVGKLEHGPGGNVVKGCIPPQYFAAAPCCDHCGTNRRRSKTFVLRRVGAQPDEFKQVGKSCLKDFFNGDDPHRVAAYAELFLSIGEDLSEFCGDEDGERATSAASPLLVLAYAAAAIREDSGYVSAAQGDETGRLTTGAVVRANLSRDCPPALRLKVKPIDDDLAHEVKDWLQSPAVIERSQLQGYWHNLVMLGRQEAIDLSVLV